MALSKRRIKAAADRKVELELAYQRQLDQEAEQLQELIATAKRMLLEAGDLAPEVTVTEFVKVRHTRNIRWLVMSATRKNSRFPIWDEGARVDLLSKRFLSLVAKHCARMVKENSRRAK